MSKIMSVYFFSLFAYPAVTLFNNPGSFMKKVFCILSLVMMASSAFANGKVILSCKNTSFTDLEKIEIVETDLKGQYQIVETSNVVDAPSVISSVFNEADKDQIPYPMLSEWNGYTRQLIRDRNSDGTSSYSILLQDECTSSISSLTCTENY